MDFLKVFATFDSRLSLSSMEPLFATPLFSQVSDETLYISSDDVELTIEEYSAGEFLLRGEVRDITFLERYVTPPLAPVIQRLQMDVFEEDGRLCKRIITE